MLRAKGLIWLASRHDMVGMWSQAGMSISFDPGRRRYAAVPKEEWPDAPETLQWVRSVWDEKVGDRRQ